MTEHVVIAGGGPTGLMLAGELALRFMGGDAELGRLRITSGKLQNLSRAGFQDPHP
jgi:hypothetical protein